MVEAQQDRGMSQSAILQHWLRLQTIPFPHPYAVRHLRDAIVVGVDAEWYEHNPDYITELGVSVLDPRFITDWSSPWEVLRMMVNHHVRIKPNAHIVNSELCHGYPEDFQFGKSTFVSVEEAQSMLRHLFTRFDVVGQRRPVIFLGHAVDNDAKMMKERFGFDIESLGVVVATVDTQALAVEVSFTARGRKIRLRDVVEEFVMSEKYLHNAGNDIVCTMMCAMLMQTPRPTKENQALYQQLKERLQASHKPSYGDSVFCTKCDSSNHVAANCDAVVHCEHCAKDPHRRNNANTHKTEKCLAALREASTKTKLSLRQVRSSSPLPCPCQYCIESPDPERHNVGNAYHHKKEDCIWGSKDADVHSALV